MRLANFKPSPSMEDHHSFGFILNPYLAIKERFEHQNDRENVLLLDHAFRVEFCDNLADCSFNIALIKRTHFQKTFQNALKLAENGVVFDIMRHEVNNLFQDADLAIIFVIGKRRLVELVEGVSIGVYLF